VISTLDGTSLEREALMPRERMDMAGKNHVDGEEKVLKDPVW
jgi:hypothetical protein